MFLPWGNQNVQDWGEERLGEGEKRDSLNQQKEKDCPSSFQEHSAEG